MNIDRRSIKSKKSLSSFKEIVEDFYEKNKRNNLPWRKNTSLYNIVVSEIMLQQTQVDRVIPFFEKWVEKFPDFESLAQASKKDVLAYWKGLGYSSRALRLQKLAQKIVTFSEDEFPQTKKEWEDLPGVGPYTAGAILAFSYNKYSVIIETNIRRVCMYHFFHNKESVSDKEIFKLMSSWEEPQSSREWYWALMDYGSYLKFFLKENPNKRSKQYTRQSPFKGSKREVRSYILSQVLEKEISLMKLMQEMKQKFSFSEIVLKEIIDKMMKEEIIHIDSHQNLGL